MIWKDQDNVQDEDCRDGGCDGNDLLPVPHKVLACRRVVLDAVDKLCPEEEGDHVCREREEREEALEGGVQGEAPPLLRAVGVHEAEGRHVEDLVHKVHEEREPEEHVEEPLREEVQPPGLVPELPEADVDADELEDAEGDHDPVDPGADAEEDLVHADIPHLACRRATAFRKIA